MYVCMYIYTGVCAYKEKGEAAVAHAGLSWVFMYVCVYVCEEKKIEVSIYFRGSPLLVCLCVHVHV